MSCRLKAVSTLKTMGNLIFALFLGVAVTGAQEAKSIYKVSVDGLSCPFCTYGIEKKFSKIKGVEKIDIDLKTGKTIITMATGATMDETTARKAVEAAGFTLRDFEQVVTPLNNKDKE